tara:strand:+ start:220977 stop:221906 length:930 start_codon:yes stop_codon:yes gene_type:complete
VKLTSYISDLLYRYECVIIPDFGGFVTNTKSAQINHFSKIFHPPSKQLTFNNHLKNNDGLLANYIASVDKIPFKCAMNFIQFEIDEWRKELENNDLVLDRIGKLRLEKDNLIFEPQTEVNYLTTSYGLSSFVSPEIKREASIEAVEEVEKEAPILVSQKSKETPQYLKYAAFFVLGLSVLGFGGNKLYQDYKNNQEVISLKKEQLKQNKQIQEATFIISDPLPSIIINAKTATKPYHVIAGAFRFPENAERMVKKLKDLGFNARILGVNEWGLTQVSFDSYPTNADARQGLHVIRETIAKDAWLLVEDL